MKTSTLYFFWKMVIGEGKGFKLHLVFFSTSEDELEIMMAKLWPNQQIFLKNHRSLFGSIIFSSLNPEVFSPGLFTLKTATRLG